MKEEYKWAKDYNECHYESPAHFLWFYVMHGCGCGSSEKFIKDFWEVFSKIKEGQCHYEYIYKDEYNELIAQMLDSRGLLEHGTSVAGSWLSEEGEALYEVLKARPTSDER